MWKYSVSIVEINNALSLSFSHSLIHSLYDTTLSRQRPELSTNWIITTVQIQMSETFKILFNTSRIFWSDLHIYKLNFLSKLTNIVFLFVPCSFQKLYKNLFAKKIWSFLFNSQVDLKLIVLKIHCSKNLENALQFIPIVINYRSTWIIL